MIGTNNLEKQGSEIGNAVTSVRHLRRGNDYLIVDPGMNEWNGGYQYRGMDKNENYHIFEDMLYVALGEKRDLFIFSQAEMEEMIKLSQVAEEANGRYVIEM